MKGFQSLKRLGPGLVTGAADDDPSGIATYSQAGAGLGTSLLWTMVLAYPLMSAVQLISARIGRVTGRGLTANLGQVMPRWIVIVLIALLFIANTINIGADLAAMGEAAHLVAGASEHIYTIVFALVSLTLQIFVPYRSYANYLKWLAVVLLAYVALVFMVKVDWPSALKDMVIPHVSGATAVTTIVAVFGTTISPFLFVWQAAQEVEEIEEKDKRQPLKDKPDQAPDAFKRIRWDTFAGMAVSNIVALAIMLGTAATLHAAGKTEIESAADAAKALQPVAGQFAFLIFSLGIIGTGMLAVPVLAGSSAFAIGEAAHWKTGLQNKPREAPAFYLVIASGMALGVAIDWSSINPMKALFWSAVINGVVAVPVLIGTMLAVASPKVMGDFTAPRLLLIFGWITTAVMAVATIAMAFVPGQ